MSNPDYATLLPQIPLLSGQAKRDKEVETFVFNVPLTQAERQLFEYGQFAYMRYTPEEGYGAIYPTSDDTAYVGNYEGFPPVFATGETLPVLPVEPEPTPPEPDPDPPVPPTPPTPPIVPPVDPDVDDVNVVTPGVVQGEVDLDIQSVENYVVLFDSNGRLMIDSNGEPITLENMTYSASRINIKLSNLE